MTDIHCHILPHVDDGADSLDDALAMARAAWKSGVKNIAATPHFFGEERSVSVIPLLKKQFSLLRNALVQCKIPITLFEGAEVLCTAETPLLAKQSLLPTLGHGRYVLCEFFFDESAGTILRIIDQIASSRYIPVIAHPERYDAFQNDPSFAEYFFDAGFPLQLNRGSILGRFGNNAQTTAEYLLSHGLCHAIASDAHSPHRRTTYMADVRQIVSEHFGQALADALLCENPARILYGRRVLEPDEL